jgi:hypothetical protein
MIVCTYKRSVSHDGKPYVAIDEQEFKTPNELEAYRVVQAWNDRGRFAQSPWWRYDFVKYRPATLEDRDNDNIPYRTRSAC